MQVDPASAAMQMVTNERKNMDKLLKGQLAAVKAQQGSGVARQYGAHGLQQAPVTFAFRQVAGQVRHQREQGSEKQFCSHFDLV